MMSSVEIFEAVAFSRESPFDAQADPGTRNRKNANRDELFKQLKLDLLRATFEPGERLIEERLAERLGASRTPVREVLTRLASEGLIGTRGRSYVALQVPTATLKEVFEVRKALEILAIGEAAKLKTDAGMESISRAMETMRDSHARGDWLATNAADSLFHLSIAEMSKNKTLFDALCQIHERVLLIRNQFFANKTLQTVALEEHDRIFDAIARGAKGVARAEIEHHIDGTINKFMRRLDGQDAEEETPANDHRPTEKITASGGGM
ncbi:GntR family transcriptional regulator [Ruegeria sp.]|uniref:GntR family transcriptional regulator n=1 Tax=Ruegeria sp. TaxID=1879320 RepID=UPI00231E4298|nr:GntR family transcriptional regulator [Ruegeria sp.]MDA7965559.1 GntR family transcriptional regulator [Ruegeria sp.]